jgi:hypothetical protein
MDKHKFAVTIHIEMSKGGIMDNEAEARANILDFLPTIAEAMSKQDDRVIVSVPADPIRVITE